MFELYKAECLCFVMKLEEHIYPNLQAKVAAVSESKICIKIQIFIFLLLALDNSFQIFRCLLMHLETNYFMQAPKT